MMYRTDGTAAFVGLERGTGRTAGKSGSFALNDGKAAGTFDCGASPAR